jgi:ribonuclease-3
MAHSRDKQSREFLGTDQPRQDPARYYSSINHPEKLLAALGVDVKPGLLVHALSHRSFSHDHPGLPNNERLEFLGDAVLELVVTKEVISRYPQWPEGRLTFIRAKSVDQDALAHVAHTTLHLSDFILLGDNERQQGDAHKDTILSDAVEALIGAVFLQHGFQTASAMVVRLLDSTITTAAQSDRWIDWKSMLLVLAHQNNFAEPTYRTVSDGNLTHPTYTASVVMADGSIAATGQGSAKRKAQELAAKRAYQTLAARYESADENTDTTAPAQKGE